MPTYDYVCEACGHALEVFHAMSAPSLRTCPKCGRRRLRRRIGAGAGVIFKGSGFYQTDYKSPPPPRNEAAKDGAGDGGKATGEGKTEAKGGGKAEAKGGEKTEASGGGKSEANRGGKSAAPGGKAPGPHRPRSERGRA